MNLVAVRTAETQSAARPRSLVLHQVAKDLRRHRWMLAGWFTLLGAAVWFFGSFRDVIIDLGYGAGFVLDLLAVLVTARIVFEDPLAGSGHVFWRTLPLGRSTLLWSRLLLLALVVVLPVMAGQFLALVRLRIPGDQIPASLASALLWESALIVSYALLATLVRGALRYLGAAVLVTLGLLLVVMFLTQRSRPLNDLVARFADWGAAPTVLALVVGSSLLVLRYLAGPRRWLPLFWGGTVVVVASFWVGLIGTGMNPHPPVARHAPSAEAPAGLFDLDVRLEPRPGASDGSGTLVRGGDGLFGSLVTGPAPDSCALVPGAVRSRIRFPEGKDWVLDQTGLPWLVNAEPAYERVLGLPGAGEDHLMVQVARVPETAGGLDDSLRRGTLTAELTLDGYRFRPGPSFPLRRGAGETVGRFAVQVVRADTDARGTIRIAVRTGRFRHAGEAPRPSPPVGMAVEFADGERSWLGFNASSSTIRLLVGWPRLVVHQSVLNLVQPSSNRPDLPAGRDLDGARVLTSTAAYLGSVDRTFRVENFRPGEW